MKNKLKSLGEHNAQTSTWLLALSSNEPQPNGIACPNCGKELYDSSPMVTLTSYPPQKNIHCVKCDYTGYRVA